MTLQGRKLPQQAIGRVAYGRPGQAILKRAFEGKLVPQDLNDEPASVLLDHIHAERGAVSAKQTPRKGRSRKRVLPLYNESVPATEGR